jgi:hypothetical protein
MTDGVGREEASMRTGRMSIDGPIVTDDVCEHSTAVASGLYASPPDAPMSFETWLNRQNAHSA